MFRYYSLQKYKNRGSVQAVSGINPQNVHIIVHMALRFRNRIYATFAAEKYGQNEVQELINKYNKVIDEKLKAKENDLMTI